MKHVFLAALCAATLLACNPKENSGSTANDSTATASRSDMPFDTLVTFCNWNEVGVRDTPSDKGKYVTTIYLGEQLQLPGDTAIEEVQGKKNLFRKVKLSDGKEGWVRSDFLAVNVVPGVILRETNIYLRPDEAAVSDKKFNALDIVAVRPSKGNWVEGKGKPMSETWYQSGFIHLGPNISLNKVETEFGFRYNRALAAKDEATKTSRMDALRNDTYLQKSDLYAMTFPDPDVNSDEDPGPDEAGDASADAVYTFTGTTGDLENHGAMFIPDRDGKPNSALHFDGNAYLRKDIDVTENASYCFWIKPEKVQDGVAFIIGNACTSGYALNLSDDKTGGVLVTVLCGGVEVDVTHSNYSIAIGQWVHLCLVKSGNDFTIIADGKISSQGASAFNPADEGLTFGGAWGCNPTELGGTFYGSLDDLFICDYTIDEDKALMIRGVTSTKIIYFLSTPYLW